ncbi:MAG: MarR family transcriptional regulator [Cellulomonas sp.]|uniref:MarR family winged helix-turn-helix transcriptional regulator n=1 Tax=Cellulomonas sp. TaxID=40001 RepID=UPI0017E91A35|nr:MarR family transcriptional regulator [Cellulomonas sp.]NMM16981.1 MarR family transcriptional regulator [Cellulomonas sp.]NMM32019.1 MarR family transcriptional regulator [Cellulomonas sp.]
MPELTVRTGITAAAHVVPAAPTAKQCRPAELAADLRIGIFRSARRLRAERGSADLPDHQYSVLGWLSKNGPLAPGVLAEMQHVQPPSMTRSVNTLVELGLVRKSEHPTDGRQVVVSLTDAGVTEVKETLRRRDTWLAERLAELNPAERSTMAAAARLMRGIADS